MNEMIIDDQRVADCEDCMHKLQRYKFHICIVISASVSTVSGDRSMIDYAPYIMSACSSDNSPREIKSCDHDVCKMQSSSKPNLESRVST